MTLKNIIVPLDGSVAAEQVLRVAAELAQAVGAKVYLVGVALSPEAIRQVGKYLSRKAQDLSAETEVIVRSGDPVDEILTVASQLAEPLLLLAAHGTGATARVLLGRTAAALLAAARIPAMAVDTLLPAPKRDGRVAILLPDQEQAKDAIWYAAELAAGLSAQPRLEVLTGPDDGNLGYALLDSDLTVVVTDRSEGIPRGVLQALAAGVVRGEAVPVVKLGLAAIAKGRTLEGRPLDATIA